MAAALGCEDFSKMCGFSMPFANIGLNDHYAAMYLLPTDSKRINRYAAAVCAEWWQKYNYPAVRSIHPDFTFAKVASMIEQAREFGHKYGLNRA